MPKKINILVVDDDPDTREIVHAHLETYGYQVILARDALEGISEARKTTPDLLLLDVVMPGMDGWQMLSLIRKDPRLKQIPVIVFTAKQSVADVDKSFTAGADAYISKPIDWEKLHEKIEKLVR